MITIIHGEDIKASRDHYYQLRQQTENPLIFTGDSLELTNLIQNAESGGLFDAPKTIFIEDLYSKKKSKKEIDAIISYLKTKETDLTIILWENKPLTKTVVNQFKKAKNLEFAYPKQIFAFLEAIKPNNGPRLVALFHELLQTKDAEFVLFMLIRQVRLLLGISGNSSFVIDEAIRIQPWQQSRLRSQAATFSKDQLIRLHKNLYELDRGSKTGSLPISLQQTIDFLLLEL